MRFRYLRFRTFSNKAPCRSTGNVLESVVYAFWGPKKSKTSYRTWTRIPGSSRYLDVCLHLKICPAQFPAQVTPFPSLNSSLQDFRIHSTPLSWHLAVFIQPRFHVKRSFYNRRLMRVNVQYDSVFDLVSFSDAQFWMPDCLTCFTLSVISLFNDNKL